MQKNMKTAKQSVQMGLQGGGQQASDVRIPQSKFIRATQNQDKNHDAVALLSAASCDRRSMNTKPYRRTESCLHAAHAAMVPRMLKERRIKSVHLCSWTRLRQDERHPFSVWVSIRIQRQGPYMGNPAPKATSGCAGSAEPAVLNLGWTHAAFWAGRIVERSVKLKSRVQDRNLPIRAPCRTSHTKRGVVKDIAMSGNGVEDL